MSIPSIVPYQMLKDDELPTNLASWKIDPDRSLLLIHDMQQFFVEKFPAGQPPVTDLVANIALILERCTELGVPVAYTAQPGSMTDEQRGLLKDFWGSGMTAEPTQRNIIEQLAPRDEDHVFTKWRYSAFHKSGLLQLMRDRKRDQIIICGVYAHVGCLMTANEAFTNDIETFFVADAIADFTIDEHRLAVNYAAQRCAVVLNTATALSMIGPQA